MSSTGLRELPETGLKDVFLSSIFFLIFRIPGLWTGVSGKSGAHRRDKTRIIFALLTVNGVVLVLSGAFGYLLAGRTLKPIQNMVEEQNRFIADASHELKRQ